MLRSIQALSKQFGRGGERRGHPQLHDVTRQRMVLGIPQDARGHFPVALEPRIEFGKSGLDPRSARLKPPQICQIGQRITFERDSGTRQHQIPFSGEMSIIGVPLNPGPICNLGNGRAGRSECAVQLYRGFDYALPRLFALHGALP